MSAPKSTYVSSSGHLTAPPITKRISDALSDYASIAYLFVETFVTVCEAREARTDNQPIFNPRSIVPQGQQPSAGAGGGTWRGGGGRLGGTGGGGAGGGGRGFMTMNDIRGGRELSCLFCR